MRTSERTTRGALARSRTGPSSWSSDQAGRRARVARRRLGPGLPEWCHQLFEASCRDSATITFRRLHLPRRRDRRRGRRPRRTSLRRTRPRIVVPVVVVVESSSNSSSSRELVVAVLLVVIAYSSTSSSGISKSSSPGTPFFLIMAPSRRVFRRVPATVRLSVPLQRAWMRPARASMRALPKKHRQYTERRSPRQQESGHDFDRIRAACGPCAAERRPSGTPLAGPRARPSEAASCRIRPTGAVDDGAVGAEPRAAKLASAPEGKWRG